MSATDDATPLGETELLRFVSQQGIAAELVRPGAPTPTVAAAAAALGVERDAIVKSLVFLTNDTAWLVIAAGDRRIAMPRLAAELGVSRRQLRLATPEQALDLAGYAVGAMPPFAHRRPLPTLIDSASVPGSGTVYAGGGSRDALLRLSVATLHAATQARRVPLTEVAARPASPNPTTLGDPS